MKTPFSSLALLLAAAIHLHAQGAQFEYVREEARRLAALPFQPNAVALPAPLANLDYDEWRKIKFRTETEEWKGLPWGIQWIHPGYIQRGGVQIFRVSGTNVTPVPYSPSQFNFTGTLQPGDFPKEGVRHAGFRLLFERWKGEYKEVLSFLGASYFRSLGQAEHFGASSRGIAINTGLDEPGEEFPSFTKFWVTDPEPGKATLHVWALLDGPSVAGAYEFTVTPQIETVVQVRAALFFRNTPKLVGIAPLTSMFWFGENSVRKPEGFRPEVHDSDGLLIGRENGAWCWHPLTNPSGLLTNSFIEENPRGFGLMQRDREDDHYKDGEAHYDARPSVWVEPDGAWGQGELRLFEWPTQNEYQDNIAAFWAPKRLPKPGEEYRIGYTMHWGSAGPIRPDLAEVVSTRTSPAGNGGQQEAIVEFERGYAQTPGKDLPVQVAVGPQPDAAAARLEPTEKGWRVHLIPAPGQNRRWLTCEIIQAGKPISEQWHSNLQH